MARTWFAIGNLMLVTVVVTGAMGLAARSACGQDSPFFAGTPRMLEADRDAFTPATTTVGKEVTLFESSYAYIDNRHDADINSVPESLLR